MGKFFSDEVEQAMDYIYYREPEKRGQEGFDLLSKAAEAGDADAMYILSRCYCGDGYVWKYHYFPEDDDIGIELMLKSVQKGSALGVLGAIRIRKLTEEDCQTMPFKSIREAWDVVYKKAQDGEAFCQYMIGNTYYWRDVLKIENRPMSSFINRAEYIEYITDRSITCVYWYEKAIANGLYMAAANLINFYGNGDDDIVPPQPVKKRELLEKLALLESHRHQEWYAEVLQEEGNHEEAFVWYQKAAQNGQDNCWYDVGRAYQEGRVVEQDVIHALSCFEKGIATRGDMGSYNCAAEIFYEGKYGVEQNYKKAIEYFEIARKENKWGNHMLADCYIHGYGCEKNYEYAIEVLNEDDDASHLGNYLWGLILTGGLGTQIDIKTGVSFFKNSEHPLAKKELAGFKKGFFGKWSKI